jgi:Fe-coproporphyrin III synthase
MSGLSTAFPAACVQIHPLRACNLACAHCYTSSGPHARETLPLDKLEGALADASALGYRMLAVSGGEPLMYKPLAGLLAAARRLEYRTSVTTNGLLASGRRLTEIAPHLDLLAISIDGLPDSHDRIRRKPGAFEKTIANLADIRACGVPFAFIFTLTLSNLHELRFVAELACRHGAAAVQVHPMSEDGRAGSDMTGLAPDGLELGAALLEASRIEQATGVRIVVDATTSDMLADLPSCASVERRTAALPEFAPNLVVRSDGVVLPWSHAVEDSVGLGSLHDASLRDLAGKWLQSDAPHVLERSAARALDELARAPGVFNWAEEVAQRINRDWAMCAAAPASAALV